MLQIHMTNTWSNHFIQLFCLWINHGNWTYSMLVSFFPFGLTDKEVIQRGRVIERGEVAVGTQLVQAIPPGLFWRFHITVHHPEYVKFNISLTRDALLGIYGRRNIPPTHTQVITCKHQCRKYNPSSFH